MEERSVSMCFYVLFHVSFGILLSKKTHGEAASFFRKSACMHDAYIWWGDIPLHLVLRVHKGSLHTWPVIAMVCLSDIFSPVTTAVFLCPYALSAGLLSDRDGVRVNGPMRILHSIGPYRMLTSSLQKTTAAAFSFFVPSGPSRCTKLSTKCMHSRVA